MSAEDVIEAALGKLDLATKARLLAGQDMWTLPAVPAIGLQSLVMSDGPIGVRGTRWTPEDPSIALPSPTALAATWSPELAREAGRLLAQEARRKGVHVLLAPTVNLHRSPLGGRHFECYSEDPLLTGKIGVGYVRGVQDGGVGTTVKHFVGNDFETDRFTVDVQVSERALRELYLAPFEAIVREGGAWGVMTSYNQVNGTTMTEHAPLVNGVLKGEWGFDGINVSDWTAARDTIGAALGGLDIAMPGPMTVYGDALAKAVENGDVPVAVVDEAVRRVLRLAARVGALDGVPPAVTQLPPEIDGSALARKVAAQSFVLVRNENGLLPLARPSSVAVIGVAASDARVLGGGSATVFPPRIVSPLEGLSSVLPVTYALGADPRKRLPAARTGFTLEARFWNGNGGLLGVTPMADGKAMWLGELPGEVELEPLTRVELLGEFVPQKSGTHRFGVTGVGEFRLRVDGIEVFRGTNEVEGNDPAAFLNPPETVVEVSLEAGRAVPVSLTYSVPKVPNMPFAFVSFTLGHAEPTASPDELIEEAVAAAAGAEVAIVVVGTTEEVESEGFDRSTLALPGRQDELVARVAAANPRTVVVVNAGSPVEMPWRESVGAVLLTWFPGQEAGAALADVLTGALEPGGRLPTTWPAREADVPVLSVTPVDGVVRYEEDLFIGYRAWQRAVQESGAEPAYWFGHGLGYTDWSYDSVSVSGRTVSVSLRNTGQRPGREIVQIYLAARIEESRPMRWLAGFAAVEASPGESVTATIEVDERATQIWDNGGWVTVPGEYRLEAGRSIADIRLVGAFTA
jgi:beta-glucosidase